MNGIGHRNVESYVRALVSERFGKRLEDAAGNTEQSGGPDKKTPPSAPNQTNNRKKNQRNDTGS
jgi:hypothetical protein